MEERGRGGVDGAREKHEALREHVCRKSGDKRRRGQRPVAGHFAPSPERRTTHRKTVCPSTPVCSKLIPAAPSAQTMICNYTRSNIRRSPFLPRSSHTPCRTTGSCTSPSARRPRACMSRTENYCTAPRGPRAPRRRGIQRRVQHQRRAGRTRWHARAPRALCAGRTRPCGSRSRARRPS